MAAWDPSRTRPAQMVGFASDELATVPGRTPGEPTIRGVTPIWALGTMLRLGRRVARRIGAIVALEQQRFTSTSPRANAYVLFLEPWTCSPEIRWIPGRGGWVAKASPGYAKSMARSGPGRRSGSFAKTHG